IRQSPLGAACILEAACSTEALPASCLRRPQRGVDDALHLPGLAKIGALIFSTGDRGKKVRNLNGLQIVKTQLMTGSRTKATIRTVLRTGLNASEPTVTRIAACAEE